MKTLTFKSELKSSGRIFSKRYLTYVQIYIALIHDKNVTYMTSSNPEMVVEDFKQLFNLEINYIKKGMNNFKLIINENKSN